VAQKELRKFSEPGFLSSAPGKELNRKIFESWGVITLSRVGFDLFHKHAVIYVQLIYCGLCGEGEYLFLSKTNGVWKVDERALTWIS